MGSVVVVWSDSMYCLIQGYIDDNNVVKSGLTKISVSRRRYA